MEKLKNILNSSEQIIPKFTNINLLRSTFDISISGKAINTVYLDARNVDKVVVEVDSQQYKDGKWTTIKDWSNFKSGTKLVENTSDISSVIGY